MEQEQNRRVFGKCANRQGHGHNYTLEVIMKGETDQVTGFVVDLKELKNVMKREVIVYDHRHLNYEVPEFAGAEGLQPTTEDVALSIWRRLDGKIPNAALRRLHVSRLRDERNRELFGKCNHPSGHGHNYTA